MSTSCRSFYNVPSAGHAADIKCSRTRRNQAQTPTFACNSKRAHKRRANAQIWSTNRTSCSVSLFSLATSFFHLILPRSLAIGGAFACSLVGYGWYTYMTEDISGNARQGYKRHPDSKSKADSKSKLDANAKSSGQHKRAE